MAEVPESDIYYSNGTDAPRCLRKGASCRDEVDSGYGEAFDGTTEYIGVASTSSTNTSNTVWVNTTSATAWGNSWYFDSRSRNFNEPQQSENKQEVHRGQLAIKDFAEGFRRRLREIARPLLMEAV